MRLTPEREKEIDEYLSSLTGRKPLMNVTGALREQKEEIDALREENAAQRDCATSDEALDIVIKQRDQLREALEVAKEALKWIDKPDHFEPDQYTQTACFQHRAYEALKKIEGVAIDACRGEDK